PPLINSVQIKNTSIILPNRLGYSQRLWDLMSSEAQTKFKAKFSIEQFLNYFAQRGSSSSSQNLCSNIFSGLGLTENFILSLNPATAQNLVKNVLAFRFGISWDGKEVNAQQAADGFINAQKILLQKETLSEHDKLRIADYFLGSMPSSVGKISEFAIQHRPISSIVAGNPEKLVLENLGFSFNAALSRIETSNLSNPFIQVANANSSVAISQEVKTLYTFLPSELNEDIPLDSFNQALVGTSQLQGRLEFGFKLEDLQRILRFSEDEKKLFVLEFVKCVFGKTFYSRVENNLRIPFTDIPLPGLSLPEGVSSVSNIERAGSFVFIYRTLNPRLADEQALNELIKIFVGANSDRVLRNKTVHLNQIVNRPFSHNSPLEVLDELSVEACILRNYLDLEVIN
ncbi:MAG: hypothetical protein SFU25_08600, partial [Candidatus Caenarcaniphilales bacterium]|nr:hypothetical protein [Candidatus Caenarcaniphilales bacterium]